MEKPSTVTEERWKHYGGSDIPIIMGMSPFKTRWQLLQEKAQLAIDEFTGNEYTEYGNVMEPLIRDFVNEVLGKNFVPDCKIDGDVRCNTDGWDKDTNEILEIKTTSNIKDSVDDYKVYLVQLLFYMKNYGAENGYLAVYERPEDFSTEFNPLLCTIHQVNIHNYEALLSEIDFQLDKFRRDLAKLIENPLLTEEDLVPHDIVAIANEVVELERQLALAKRIDEEAKEFKAKLYQMMMDNGIDKWETTNGVKITLVKPTDKKIVQEFDEAAFKEDNEELWEYYVHNTTKPGRSGYVKVTIPKGDK